MFVDGFATFLWILVFLSAIDLTVTACINLYKIYTERKLRESGKVLNETFLRYSLSSKVFMNAKRKQNMITGSEKKTLLLLCSQEKKKKAFRFKKKRRK